MSNWEKAFPIIVAVHTITRVCPRNHEVSVLLKFLKPNSDATVGQVKPPFSPVDILGSIQAKLEPLI